jgi:hypothetical protein
MNFNAFIEKTLNGLGKGKTSYNLFSPMAAL